MNRWLPVPHNDDDWVKTALQLLADCMRWRLRLPRLLFAPKETYVVVEAWFREPEGQMKKECRICHQVLCCHGVSLLLVPVTPNKDWSPVWICLYCLIDYMDPKILDEYRFGLPEHPLFKGRREEIEDHNDQNSAKVVVFRVRREYFDQIRADTKKVELRKDSPYWRRHLISQHPPNIALFLCGKEKIARRIVLIRANKDPEAILGRPLSEQERLDIPTPTCFAIYLGEVVHEVKGSRSLK